MLAHLQIKLASNRHALKQYMEGEEATCDFYLCVPRFQSLNDIIQDGAGIEHHPHRGSQALKLTFIPDPFSQVRLGMGPPDKNARITQPGQVRSALSGSLLPCPLPPPSLCQ